MSIECKISSIEEIKFDEKIIEKMYLLMYEHYDNINIVKFKRDLYSKDKVFLIYNSEMLIGFSTLKKMSLKLNEEKIIGLFSGDTIIKKGYSWGLQFQKEWIKYCLEESEKNKKLNISTYWFLISKGIKTYMYLPTYFNSYTPKLNYSESEFEKSLKNIYAKKLYGERYIEESGIIKNDNTNDYLKENIENINLKKKEDENINFFISKNPNYMQGDELVCLTHISYENLTKLGKRVIKDLNI